MYRLTPILLSFAFCLPSIAQQARILGTVQSALGPSLEVKADDGAVLKVTTSDKINVRKVAPGAKDLASAQPVTLDDLASGDRVLLRGTRTGNDFAAESIVLMSSREIVQKNQAETAEWTRRGVAGLVDRVDAAKGEVIVLVRSGMQQPAPVTVTASEKTEVKRYAKDSVKYASAEASKLSEVKKGDQLRALGAKSEDGSKLSAERIVFGSFRSAAGTITSIDAATKTLQIKDWQNDQPLTVRLAPEAVIKKMPQGPMGMGRGGMRPPGSDTAESGRPPSVPSNRPPGMPGDLPEGRNTPPVKPDDPLAAGRSPSVPSGRPPGMPGDGGPPGMMGRPGGGPPDFSAMLERMPAVTFTDLQPGDTIIISATPTDKPSSLTALTIVAGAEMILARLSSAAPAQMPGGRPGGMGGAGMAGTGAAGLDAIMGVPGIQ